MTKTASGDVSFQFEGKTIELRLDFEAVATIEERLNKSVIDVFNMNSGENPKVRDLVILVVAITHGQITEDEALTEFMGENRIEFLEPFMNCVKKTLNPRGDKTAGKKKTPKKVK